MRSRATMVALVLLLPSAAWTQASAFAHLRGPGLRAIREATLYINLVAPGSDSDLLYADLQDTAVAMLEREGITLKRGSRTGAVAIYPGLFIELVTIPVGPDSVRVAASLVVVEVAQAMRSRSYAPAMTWGVRNWPTVARDRLLLDGAVPLLQAFIHDWRCSTGRLGVCSQPGVPQ